MYYGFSNPMLHANQSLIGSVKVDTDATDGYDALFDTVYIVAMLGNGYGAFDSFSIDGWLSYGFSKNVAAFATRLVMFLDKVAIKTMVKPTKPWARFLGAGATAAVTPAAVV